MPPSPTPGFVLAPEPLLSDAEVSDKLEKMFRDGVANLRYALPVLLGAELAPPSFGSICRDWVSSIREAPSALCSSRLATPPPVPFSLPIAAVDKDEEACDDGDVADIAAPDAGRVVPVCWDEGESGTEAWSELVVVDAVSAVEVSPQLALGRLDGGMGVEASLSLAISTGEEEEVADLVEPNDPEDVQVAYLGPNEVDDQVDHDLESETIGDLLLSEAGVVSGIEHLFDRPVVPLLPTPFRPLPIAAVSPDQLLEAQRRSSRLAAKPQLPAVDKALTVLQKKLGFKDESLSFMQARQQYMDLYKTVLPDKAIAVINTLIKLNIPSIVAADASLIDMAGPGGAELASSTTVALDASA